MTELDAVEIVERLVAAGVPARLDGWGIDALVAHQTRPHADLDLVVARADVGCLRDALTPPGFVVAVDELPTRRELDDGRRRRIDLHPVTFDVDGSGFQVLQDGTEWR